MVWDSGLGFRSWRAGIRVFAHCSLAPRLDTVVCVDKYSTQSSGWKSGDPEGLECLT